MGAVTYPDAKVTNFISENLIPLQILSTAQPWVTNFNVKWTPTLITLDAEGKEYHRTLGFLAPQELIPSLILGLAKVHFSNDRFKEALANLDKLVGEYPKSSSTPEAIYLRGVCRYKNTKEPKHLKEAYQLLKAEYPASEWTMRADPYRLIQ